jgi:hypothetical protein
MKDDAGFVEVLKSATWLATTCAPNFDGDPEIVDAEEGRDAGRMAGDCCGCAAEGFAVREGDCGTVECEEDVGVDGGRGPGRRRAGDLREKIPWPGALVEDSVTECDACVTLETDKGVRNLSGCPLGARIFCSISSSRRLIWLNCACSLASASGSLSSGSA